MAAPMSTEYECMACKEIICKSQGGRTNHWNWCKKYAEFVVREGSWKRLSNDSVHKCPVCLGPDILRDTSARRCILPKSKGGKETIGNMIPVCGACYGVPEWWHLREYAEDRWACHMQTTPYPYPGVWMDSGI
jgi:hypothetical protein